MSIVYEHLTTAEDVSDAMHANRRVEQSDDLGASWTPVLRVMRADGSQRCPIARVSTGIKVGTLFRTAKK